MLSPGHSANEKKIKPHQNNMDTINHPILVDTGKKRPLQRHRSIAQPRSTSMQPPNLTYHASQGSERTKVIRKTASILQRGGYLEVCEPRVGQKRGKRLQQNESKTVNDSSQSGDCRLSVSYEFSPAERRNQSQVLGKSQRKRDKKFDEKEELASNNNNMAQQVGAH